jgi:deoxycytidine triphosphate deaminase
LEKAAMSIMPDSWIRQMSQDNEGASQFLFLKGEGPPEVSYADRKGKYMRQLGITIPKL